MPSCEFFTRYAPTRKGTCAREAMHQMRDVGIPPIKMCHDCAELTVRLHPLLGNIDQRFATI